jgi:hypothetical protein
MRLILCACAAFGLVGCGPATKPAAKPVTCEYGLPCVFTDSRTGCEYLIINNPYGSALTPRLAGDGLPMCPNVKQEHPQ